MWWNYNNSGRRCDGDLWSLGKMAGSPPRPIYRCYIDYFHLTYLNEFLPISLELTVFDNGIKHRTWGKHFFTKVAAIDQFGFYIFATNQVFRALNFWLFAKNHSEEFTRVTEIWQSGSPNILNLIFRPLFSGSYLIIIDSSWLKSINLPPAMVSISFFARSFEIIL